MTLQNAFGDITLEATQKENAASLEEINVWLQQINSKTAYPDTAGRARVALDTITAGVTLPAVTTVTGVTTVSTVSNQTSMGGYNANDQVPTLMRIAANGLRANISVS